MEGSALSDRHRRSSIVNRERGLHQDARTAGMHRDTGNLSSDGGRFSQKWIASMKKNCDRSPIVTRSRRDRSSIVPRSGPPSAWHRFHSIGRRAAHDQDHDHGPIAAQSWPDRGAIVARSRRNRGPIAAQSWPDRGAIRPDRGMIMVHLKPKLRLTYLKFRSYDAAPENRAHDPQKPLPRPPLSPTNSGQFPSLKACISLLCSSTFDRFVKELSEF